MALQIITAEQRLAASSNVKAVILGEHGIGKTSLVWTLNEAETLVTDMESGMLALEGWGGLSLPVRTWEDAQAVAVLIAGPNPARRPDEAFSQNHYDYCLANYPEIVEALKPIRTIFWDSITEMSRIALHWSKGQERGKSEKTGKVDMRGAYGLVAEEVLGLLRHLQHTKDKNIIVVGGLRKTVDDYGRTIWTAMVEGAKTMTELDGIFDNVISMVDMPVDNGQPYRAFVCHKLNQWGYPAKDRSGRLALIEEPHLGKLMAKMKGGNRIDGDRTYTMPDAPAPTEPQPAA